MTDKRTGLDKTKLVR